jgi:hypothetical protein
MWILIAGMQEPMKKITTFSFITALAFLSCCEPFKVEPQLPPITMEGKNTFGCLVNGKVWLPDGSKFADPVIAFYDSSTLTQRWALDISSINVDHDSGFLLSVIDNSILMDHEYNLNDTITYAYYRNGACVYEDSHVVEGRLKILKINPQIVAGTFEFTSFNPSCGDTVKVTKGRFDIAITF